MLTETDSSGIIWLRPSNINCSEIAMKVLKSATAKEIRKDYGSGLSESEWNKLVDAVRDIIRHQSSPLEKNERLVKDLNDKLSSYALALPITATMGEAQKVLALITDINNNLKSIISTFISIVMHPRLRALQLVGRFKKLEPFEEFCYVVEASTISFYRGNMVCSYLSILPAIEGIILRLLGYPSTTSQKPTFQEIKTYIEKSQLRQPFPLQLNFMDSWIQAASRIMKDHLYKHTKGGDAYDYFNRHLALHMLEDKTFCTPENVMRAFLLLDLMTEIYICEKRITDPRWRTTHKEEKPHLCAYLAAAGLRTVAQQPEALLYGYQKCQFS